MKRLAILGSTGSVGASTLDVVARHPGPLRGRRRSPRARTTRCCSRSASRIAPRYAVLADADAAERLRRRAAPKRAARREVRVRRARRWSSVAALAEVDTVMAAIVGAAGLAARRSPPRAPASDVLLANKEALVMSGALFMTAVAEGGGTLLPIDSEHSAIFQSLPRGFACGRAGELERAGVRRILLTASGGPVPHHAARAPRAASRPQQACAHPNWVMGRKISVDSATMMNKGLEVIEAHWLFGAPLEAIEVVIHPQSVIHSMVEYLDGSVIAQLGAPDMRTPIACALAWPERIDSGVAPLDFTTLGALEFERVDPQRFPVPAPRARGDAPRRHRAGGAERRQRDRGRGVPATARLAFTGIAEVIEQRARRSRGRAARLARAGLRRGHRGARRWPRASSRAARLAPRRSRAMTSALITIVSFLVTVGVLVVIHEFGHYLVARLVGVKILRFSVGFGRTLVVRRRGPRPDRMGGRRDPARRLREDARRARGRGARRRIGRAPSTARSRGRAHLHRARRARSPISCSRSLLYWALFIAGLPGVKPVLGDPPRDTPAAVAGLRQRRHRACASPTSRCTPGPTCAGCCSRRR